MKKIIIIGGGIAGLAAAYQIQQSITESTSPVQCTLLEGSDRLGGKIYTERFDSFIVERGPDSFISQKPWALDLCRRLGLEDELIGTRTEHTSTFVYTGKKMLRMPEGLSLMVPTRFLPFALTPLFSPLGKLRMGFDLLIPKRRGKGDESLASFVRRRLGEECLRKMAEPMLAGIYASDAESMSLHSTFPMFAQTEQKYRSLILGMLARKRDALKRPKPSGNATPKKPVSMFMTLKCGLGQMIDTLVQQSPDVEFKTHSTVKAIARREDSWQVTLTDETVLSADAVIVATPANLSARLLEPTQPQLAELLGKIPYVSTAAVTLIFRKDNFSHPLEGFGFVVPRNEGHEITACTWTSSKYAGRVPEDHVMLRCYVGGGTREDAANLNEDQVVQLVRKDLESIMGIRETPDITRVYYNKKGNVQYHVGHASLVQSIEDRLRSVPGLFLAGSAYHGIGIPDCVLNGTQVAETVLQYLELNEHPAPQ